MAGIYPDYPSPRIAWPEVGATMVKLLGSTVDNTLSLEYARAIADESTGFSTEWYRGLANGNAVVFPEPFDISHLYICGAGDSAGVSNIWTSTNTTSGGDGTWVLNTSAFARDMGAGGADAQRTQIVALTTPALGIRGLKLVLDDGSVYTKNIQTLHIFGQRSTTNAQVTTIWHPTLDEPVPAAHFDWGDTPRDSVAVRTFRVKNTSATFTANDVAVTMVDSTDSSPSYTDAHTLSTDGTTYTAGLSNIGDLAPGAISGLLHVKRTIDPAQPLGLWNAVIKAAAGSWSV
jgi:hypothetical protein